MEGIGLQQEIEGLSTRQALTLLHDEIEERLVVFQTAFNASRWRLPFQVFRMGNRKSSFHWSSIVIFILCCTALLIAYGIPLSTRSDVLFYKDLWWPVEAFTLLVILALCCYLTGWDYAVEREEIARVLRQTLHKVKECSRTCTWNQRNYPDIHSPISPSVSLQWTLREGEVVNMPRSLLVKGDIILLRPGQTVPARCRDLENESGPELLSGEVFAPSVNRGSETFSLPQGRSPLKAQKFVLLKTPYIENLNMMLSGQCERPVSLLDNERYYVCTTWIERRVVPVVFCLLLLVNTLRYVYLRDTVGDWPEMLLVLPIHALIPLLPVAFPWLWKLLNYYGEARLLTAFEVCKVQKAPVSEGSFDSDSVISADEARVNMDWQQVLHNMWLIVSGRSPLITRQTNIMHVMGSVTSFCCVDKKGVLSWANPTAEKVFIMTPNPSNKPAANIETPPNNVKETKLRKRKKNALSSSDHVIPVEQSCHFEVLDLTHDAKSTFGLQFDDPNWKKNLTSLKPLGLSLLLNTCNPGAKAWYSQFTDHVASSAIKNKETVAVVNRRCLCELSKQIGFSEKATVLFDLEQCFGIYRQVPAAEAAKERMHRAHSTVQHKIPMPNMVSVVVRDSLSGTCQLMSQGTADIILDACSDYWDGSDLRPINQSDRKKMLDFYHRTSMASYCTAFSYRPLSQGISDSLQNYFIELPENSANINPHIVHGESVSSSPDGSESELSRSISVDSLMVSNTALPVEDVAGCFTAQSQQIFIGMITMQYQARQDIIQLIDQLETACIRFVHFSEENELRSRVFSEKMGLEAGWNCHISLLPPEARSPRHSVQEDNSHRTSRYSSCVSTDNIHRGSPPKVRIEEDTPNSLSKSYSAPSLMNAADNPQVKFRPDNHTTDISPTANQHYGHGGREEYRETDETMCLIGQAEIEGPLGEMSSSDDGQDIQYEIQTSSRITVNTLDSLTAMLDNRAKLPRGIEDIRPHLEHVDNVPLLVSLFTDCTQPATCEMIKIMQEYGEVVLCLGSSANIHNTGIFLQSDGSVGVQPLLPQLCARQEVMIDPWEEDRLSPIQLASSLLTLPCSLAFKREDNIHFVQLIAEARHYLMMLRNCFQLMLCCELSVSLVQVLGSVLLHLPPVLAGRHLLWLVCVVIPALCLTMMGNQVDTRIMAEATSKNSRTINKEVILQFLLYYGLRFVPSVSVCLVCCGFNSVAVCSTVLANSSNQTDCVFFQYKEELGVWNSWDNSYRGQISLIQNFALFQIVLYFVLISMSYVHKYSHIWQSPPFRNKYWLVVSLTLVLCQLVYFACDVSVSADPPSLSLIPPWSWAVALAWPVLLLIYTELLKMQEIKLMVRFQKRARLNFGTKLGMNSPF